MNLDQAIENQLNYYKRQRNIIKAHHTKASLISLRKDWLDRQTKTNYQKIFQVIRSRFGLSILLTPISGTQSFFLSWVFPSAKQHELRGINRRHPLFSYN